MDFEHLVSHYIPQRLFRVASDHMGVNLGKNTAKIQAGTKMWVVFQPHLLKNIMITTCKQNGKKVKGAFRSFVKGWQCK